MKSNMNSPRKIHQSRSVVSVIDMCLYSLLLLCDVKHLQVNAEFSKEHFKENLEYFNDRRLNSDSSYSFTPQSTKEFVSFAISQHAPRSSPTVFARKNVVRNWFGLSNHNKIVQTTSTKTPVTNAFIGNRNTITLCGPATLNGTTTASRATQNQNQRPRSNQMCDCV